MTQPKKLGGVTMNDAPPTTWVPTRKWFVNVITLLAAIAVSWVTSDGWDDAEWLLLISTVVTAATTYFTPNGTDTP